MNKDIKLELATTIIAHFLHKVQPFIDTKEVHPWMESKYNAGLCISLSGWLKDFNPNMSFKVKDYIHEVFLDALEAETDSDKIYPFNHGVVDYYTHRDNNTLYCTKYQPERVEFIKKYARQSEALYQLIANKKGI